MPYKAVNPGLWPPPFIGWKASSGCVLKEAATRLEKQIAAFFFTRHENSDALGRGDGSRHAPPAPPVEKSASLGTGHGRSEASRVAYTDFERATAAPEEVIAIHYDTCRNLVAQGVIRAPRVATPTPFPGQFVPDPR